MLLRIAICDDDENDCATLSVCLHDICSTRSIKAEIDMFTRGEDFLMLYQEKPYDMIFMDIYMDGINGLDTARNANHINQSLFIFTTVSKEHALEAFALNAVHYLVKPISEASVKEAVERAMTRLSEKSVKYLEIKTKNGMVPIPMGNIIYIEVFNKICTIHTEKNCFQTYKSLDALFEFLDSSTFIRVQRSYVVNMYYIDSFFFDHIIMQGGKKIILSRNNRAALKKQYQQFLFLLARRRAI